MTQGLWGRDLNYTYSGLPCLLIRTGDDRAINEPCLNEQPVRGRVAEFRLLDVLIEAQDATASKRIRKSTLIFDILDAPLIRSPKPSSFELLPFVPHCFGGVPLSVLHHSVDSAPSLQPTAKPQAQAFV